MARLTYREALKRVAERDYSTRRDTQNGRVVHRIKYGRGQRLTIPSVSQAGGTRYG